jgi:hypothetical protein
MLKAEGFHRRRNGYGATDGRLRMSGNTGKMNSKG